MERQKLKIERWTFMIQDKKDIPDSYHQGVRESFSSDVVTYNRKRTKEEIIRSFEKPPDVPLAFYLGQK